MLPRLLLSICLVLGTIYCALIVEDDREVTENITEEGESTTAPSDIETTTTVNEIEGLGFRSLGSSEFEDEREIEHTHLDVDAQPAISPDNSNSSVVFRKSEPSSSSSTCITPSNNNGLCVPLSQCKYLHNLLIYQAQQPGVRSLLRRSQCGDRNSVAHYVCCPVPAKSRSPTFESHAPQQSGRKPGFPLRPKLSKTPQCGNRSLTSVRVIGGQEAEMGAWPWMVTLYCTDKKKPKQAAKFQCGGSLISDQWLLSAGHCMTCITSTMTITHARLGDIFLDQSLKDQVGSEVVTIKQFIRHPKYKSSPIQNDIALIRLSRPVKFTSLIYPICLLSGESYKSDEFYVRNPFPFVAGWGSTDYGTPPSSHLMEGNVPVVGAPQCEKYYKDYKTQAVIDKRVICAGDNTRDSCTGDSGGPLMFINEKTKIVYQGGVVSFGVRCAEKDFPGVYTKVAAFIDWINNTTGLAF